MNSHHLVPAGVPQLQQKCDDREHGGEGGSLQGQVQEEGEGHVTVSKGNSGHAAPTCSCCTVTLYYIHSFNVYDARKLINNNIKKW